MFYEKIKSFFYRFIDKTKTETFIPKRQSSPLTDTQKKIALLFLLFDCDYTEKSIHTEEINNLDSEFNDFRRF